MKNIYFPDEDILENDLFFICYMIEKVARSLRQHNCYVIPLANKKCIICLVAQMFYIVKIQIR